MVSLVVEPFQHFDQDARHATRLDPGDGSRILWGNHVLSLLIIHVTQIL
jgi:hypothetical protein